MKKRRIFAVVMAAVMTLSMVACGEKQTGNEPTPTTAPTATTAPTEAPEATATPVPTEAPVQEASIDFEDGNFGFVMMKTKPRRADSSVLSLASYNGSNALYVENAGGAEMYVGFDIDAILGDKVTEVRSISMTLGTEHSDGKFASTAGYLDIYTGEALTETRLEGWSVYMAKKNPKTVTFTLPADVAFTAGNDNYICLNKLEDNGNVLSSLYIDDIRFFDANGNVIKGDTTVVMEAPNGFLKVVEEEEPASASDVKVTLDEAYMGDWGLTTAIPADAFATFTNGVKVTYKFELQSGYDYYLFAPKDAAWGAIADCGLTAKTAAEEGDKYHLQSDGFIVIDDWTNNELTLTLSADAVAAVVAAGGLAGQTYGVTTFQATLSDPSAGMMTEKVALDEAYMGDWGLTTAIPADVLSKFAGTDVTVTFKFELQSGYDYYLFAPKDAAWGAIADCGLTVKAAAEEGDKYHLQSDGFIVIDDWTNNELVLNIKAADLDAIIAAGGLAGQTYGVTTYQAVITGAAPTTIKEKVALDEAYMGDWALTTAIPADVLAKFPGDVTVTLKFELQSGYDYYLFAPKDAAWGGIADCGLTAKAAAEEGDKYHLQSDGFIVIDDWTNNELVLNIKAADLAAIIAAGGLAGQTYGVTVYEAVIEGAVPTMLKEKVDLDEAYMGDWALTTAIPADVLAKFGDVTVTLKFELQSGYDYYLFAPKDAAWGAIADCGLTAKAAAEEGDKYHLQSDGFIVIDDWTNNELVLNFKAADLAAAIAAGGLAGQTYGVTVYQAVIEGYPATEAPAADAPATEEPAAPAGPVVEGNTVTIVDGTWWTEAPITIEQLLGDVDPATVKSVTFTGTTDFTLAYTNNSGTGTAAADNPYWTQLAGATTYTATDIDFSNYLLKLCISKGDNVEYTVTWTVE